jgi:hypothetical protein
MGSVRRQRPRDCLNGDCTHFQAFRLLSSDASHYPQRDLVAGPASQVDCAEHNVVGDNQDDHGRELAIRKVAVRSREHGAGLRRGRSPPSQCNPRASDMTVVPQAATLLLRALMSGRYTFCVPLALLLLWVGLRFNAKLQSWNRSWLEWSPFHVKANVALVPIRMRWIWLPYSLLLAFCMPCFALVEELLFRAGTTSWVRGLLWGAVAFGAFHLFSLVSIRMMIYLMLVGAVFVEIYMLDGIVAVFVLHAVYNLTALGLTVASRNRGLPGSSSGGAPRDCSGEGY